jgi:hypothetical protein
MTKFQTFTMLFCSLFLLENCFQRDDILLSASDELHYIKLFDNDKAFEICHNGFNTAIGKYKFEKDTIYLTYTDSEILTQSRDGKKYTGTENELLTRKLIIDHTDNYIRSADERGFCALINCNKLKSK